MTVLESLTEIIKELLKPSTLLILIFAIFLIVGIVNFDQILSFARSLK